MLKHTLPIAGVLKHTLQHTLPFPAATPQDMLCGMAKSHAIENALSALHALRADPTAPDARQKLKEALGSKVNLIAAKAANIIADGNATGLDDDLLGAFDRFFAPGSDRGCAAKEAIARALYALGVSAETAFLRGIHHVQHEGGYGGPVDVAAELRGYCGLGLVRMGSRQALTELTDLLADREMQARAAAARALAYSGRDEAVLLLRLKALVGDAEVDVTAECLTSLVRLAPEKSIAFVARFLDAPDEAIAEAAALAIGSAARPEAFEVLRQCWERRIGVARQTLLTAMATCRIAPAQDFLIDLLRQEPIDTAAAALSALSLYRRDSAIRAKIEAVLKERNEPKLQLAFAETFGDEQR